MEGRWLKNCSCAFGCPCDFNALPTNTVCEGMVGMKIDDGHFGGVDLSGISWACVYKWPGPLYEGHGIVQAVIDESATEEQRNALLTILSGQEQVEGTFFSIIASVTETMLQPLFLPVAFDFDLEGRTARMSAPGIFETEVAPIKNPVTGADHRIRVDIPAGFEHKSAEIACATVNVGTGDVKYDWPDGHSTLAHVVHTESGVLAG